MYAYISRHKACTGTGLYKVPPPHNHNTALDQYYLSVMFCKTEILPQMDCSIFEPIIYIFPAECSRGRVERLQNVNDWYKMIYILLNFQSSWKTFHKPHENMDKCWTKFPVSHNRYENLVCNFNIFFFSYRCSNVTYFFYWLLILERNKNLFNLI